MVVLGRVVRHTHWLYHYNAYSSVIEYTAFVVFLKHETLTKVIVADRT